MRKGKKKTHEGRVVASDQPAVAPASKARSRRATRPKPQSKADDSDDTIPSHREWSFINCTQVTYRSNRGRGKPRPSRAGSRKTSVAVDFGFGGMGAPVAADAASSNAEAR